MYPYTEPYVIQCVELATGRAASLVRRNLQRRLSSLASIAATAMFLGVFSTVLGIINSFHSITGSKSESVSDISERLAEALLPTLLGLLTATVAQWFYSYLRDQLEEFNLQMETTAGDLLTILTTHLEQLRRRDPARWAVLARRPAFRNESHPPRDSKLTSPLFAPGRMFGHGLRELFGPKLMSEWDARVILDFASWLCLLYGALGALAYWFEHQPVSSAGIFAFFALSSLALRRGFTPAIVLIAAYFAASCTLDLIRNFGELTFSSYYQLVAALPLLGSYQAARYLRQTFGPRDRLLNWLLVLLAIGCLSTTILRLGPSPNDRVTLKNFNGVGFVVKQAITGIRTLAFSHR